VTSVEFFATVGALLGGLLYLYLGLSYFGADDDYWTPLRHAVLPHVDRVLGNCLDGGYATSTQSAREYAATVQLTVDELEVVLEEHGGLRNIWAASMENQDGQKSAGTWTFRRVKLPVLRALLNALEKVPLAADVLIIAEEIVAMRQVHLRLYERDDGTVDILAHEEPNSINPLTGYAHYRSDAQKLFGRRWPGKRPGVGINWVRERLDRWGVPHQVVIE
jgi:hypothetical protein